MKAEISAKFEGLCLISRTPEEDAEIDELFKKGHIHLVCQSIIPKKGRRYKRLLLRRSKNKWVKNGLNVTKKKKI